MKGISHLYDSAKSDGLWGKCPDHHAPGIARDGCTDKDCHLDPGVYELVWGLYEAGIYTSTSCQGGGPPHAYLGRVITLGINDESAGPKARDMAISLGMPLYWMHRVECVNPSNGLFACDGQGRSYVIQNPDTFWWELHFSRWVKWTRAQKSGEVVYSTEGIEYGE